MHVPYFRPDITSTDIDAVVKTLRSGWLTTGPKAKKFEAAFARCVGMPHAVALNSCTAALHLALAALGLRRGQAVLVPTLTFAATAEVVRYFGATPEFVDVEPETLCMDPDAVRNALTGHSKRGEGIVGAIPVHYGGQMAAMLSLAPMLRAAGCFVVEDAAHALPASLRDPESGRWTKVGELADVACFSFYANKTITTGEGGMATTADKALANRMRTLSLHGMSQDGCDRFRRTGTWDYVIATPGFKYNMTDVAAALGIEQLRRVVSLRDQRAHIAARYTAALSDVDAIETPNERDDSYHAWHLYPIRLRLDHLRVRREEFIRELDRRGVATSVHWRPLHMQPYYRDHYGYRPEDFPVAFREWQRLISLPLFPGMTEMEVAHVITAVRETAAEATRKVLVA